jgi:pimeloyl-ACP methyl ester carboxylesterase
MTSPGFLLVHGAFCGGWVFDRFADALQGAGREARAPDLPGHGQAQADDAVLGLSMRDYAEAVADAATTFDEPPVLVGHSLGGLVALMAATAAPVGGVVLLAPSAPWGIAGSTMEEAISAVSLYALGPFWAQTVAPEYGSFRRFAVDRLSRPARHATFERLRPESGRALFETLNWWLDPMMTTAVRTDRIGGPVLAIAGGRDVIHPPVTVRETARRIGARFELMDHMSHWLVGEPGWRDVAARCLSFADELSAVPVAAE